MIKFLVFALLIAAIVYALRRYRNPPPPPRDDGDYDEGGGPIWPADHARLDAPTRHKPETVNDE